MSIREIPVPVAGEIILPNGEVLNINELPSLDNGETYGSILEVRGVEDAVATANPDFLISADDFPKSIYGLGGNDLIIAGIQSAFLYGNEGQDQLRGGFGNDVLFGGKDSDQLEGQQGDDVLYGNQGNDALAGDAGNDLLLGGEGDDGLRGGYLVDLDFGEIDQDGDDFLSGGGGGDDMAGGQGNDFLSGDSGNDALQGEQGNDTLDGGDGFDNLTGRSGTDLMVLSPNNEGFDRISDFEDGSDLIGLREGLTFEDVLISPVGERAEQLADQWITGRGFAELFSLPTPPGAELITVDVSALPTDILIENANTGEVLAILSSISLSATTIEVVLDISQITQEDFLTL